MAKLRQYLQPLIILIIFETVAVTLWLTKNNLFYLFNFSYIGLSISFGIFLFINKYKYARRIVQLLVGLYMLVYLGLICRENMQIEGFWYYLFTGVFEAATIHYAVAKIFGPLVFGRGWCGYACWTAMVLDFLPYKVPAQPRKKIGWIRYITFALSLIFVSAVDTLYNICLVPYFRISAIPCKSREHGKNHVLGVHYRQHCLLRNRRSTCVCAKR